MKCTCPDGDYWMCIRGVVYGPCDDDNCGGVCEDHGKCPCPLHKVIVGHEPHTRGTS